MGCISRVTPRVHHKNIFSGKLHKNNEQIATTESKVSVKLFPMPGWKVNRIYISMHFYWKRKFINHLMPCGQFFKAEWLCVKWWINSWMRAIELQSIILFIRTFMFWIKAVMKISNTHKLVSLLSMLNHRDLTLRELQSTFKATAKTSTKDFIFSSHKSGCVFWGKIIFRVKTFWSIHVDPHEKSFTIKTRKTTREVYKEIVHTNFLTCFPCF